MLKRKRDRKLVELSGAFPSGGYGAVFYTAQTYLVTATLAHKMTFWEGDQVNLSDLLELEQENSLSTIKSRKVRATRSW